MKQLIFYKKFDNNFNKYQYVFKIINYPHKYDIENLIYNFGTIPNEFHIKVLYGAITDLFMSNNVVKWEKETESLDDINEIKFISDLKPNENFDIFIPQIIEKIINVIDLDFK